MDSSSNTHTLKKQYNNKSRAEMLSFDADFIEHLTLSKHKLHTVVQQDKLHSTIVRSVTAAVRAEGFDLAAASGLGELGARTAELLDTCREEAFAILLKNINDDPSHAPVGPRDLREARHPEAGLHRACSGSKAIRATF